MALKKLTQDIISSYEDKRIKICRQDKNLGLAAALNIGFSHAGGDLLSWTSDDNYYDIKAIETMLNQLLKNAIDFVYCQYQRINEDGDIIRFEKLKGPEHLSLGNCVGACFLYTRKVFETIGDYRSDLRLVEDYQYWLRVRREFKMKTH